MQFSIDYTCDFYDFTNVEFLYRVIKAVNNCRISNTKEVSINMHRALVVHVLGGYNSSASIVL